MIPFDLERAKQDVPMFTRNGFSAKLIAHLNGGQPAPLVVEVNKRQFNKNGRVIPTSTMIENYYINGRHNPVHESEYDLFMKY